MRYVALKCIWTMLFESKTVFKSKEFRVYRPYLSSLIYMLLCMHVASGIYEERNGKENRGAREGGRK